MNTRNTTVVLTDEALVNEYKNGNQQALGPLYERYYKKVYHKCLSFTKDPDNAYDLAQDILIKVFDRINSFKGESKFSTWLYSATHNHCLDVARKKSKFQFCSLDDVVEVEEESVDLEELQAEEVKQGRITELMADIPEQDRQMLIMKYQHGLSIQELQRAFGLGASAVKMRLQRARKKMQELYHLDRGPAAA